MKVSRAVILMSGVASMAAGQAWAQATRDAVPADSERSVAHTSWSDSIEANVATEFLPDLSGDQATGGLRKDKSRPAASGVIVCPGCGQVITLVQSARSNLHLGHCSVGCGG